MIVTRTVRDEADTKDMIETSSDVGYKLRQIETGKVYGHIVVDAIPLAFIYEETDELDPVEGSVEDKAEAYDILMGVSE